ncbi:hypothetical protein D4S03_07305, partial [bacterium]
MFLPAQLELQTLFSGFLLESGLSAVSIKNYLSDLRHFFSFCASSNKTVQEIFQNISKYLDLYLLEQKKSFTPQNTVNRRSASIRRFSTFLTAKFGLTSSVDLPNRSIDNSLPTISKILDHFKHFLEKEKKTHSTVKNYVSDLNHFFAWSASSTPFMDQDLENILSESQLNAYVTYLQLSHTGTSVINRRQSSIRQFTKYCFLQKYIPENPFEYKRETPRLAPLSWFNRLSSGKNKARKNGPKSRLAILYQKYNSLPFTPYLHLAILALATSAMVIFGYNQIVKQATPSSAALPTVPRRQLSFQGRLTSSSGTPITTAVDVVFKLWSHLTAGSQLYTSGTCSITPDPNGIFNTLIGNGTCGSEITGTVFTDNRDVYLEVAVGVETLTPRQQIATVGYALNSETLQGYPASASATINTVPIVDASGNITIAAASPDIISTSGTFTISGQALALQTATTSGGDVVIQPDAIGNGSALVLGSTTSTDTFYVGNALLTSGNLIAGYMGNNTATGRLLSLTAGSPELDRFYVAASGQTLVNASATLANAALIVNQYGTGDLFTASASSATKFTIGNNGNITATGTLTGLTGLTVASGTVSLPNSEINNAEISELDWTKLQNYPASCPAGQAIQQVDDTLTCIDIAALVGGTNLWQLTSASLAPVNVTYALNLGDTATTSALVHFPGTINQDAWFNLGTGNVGIGLTNPGTTLDVTGTGRFSSTLTASNGLTVTAGTVSLPNSEINNAEISELDWTKLQNYPASCPAGQAIQQVDDTLTCIDVTAVVGGTNLWQRISGSLTPINITDSLNLGTTDGATTSALVHLAGTAAENSWVNTGNFGIGTTTPATTALLDLTSTTKGFLAPRMTTDQRDAISTPATGLMIYNTTTNQYNVFDSIVWGAVGGGGGESFWTIDTGAMYPVNSTVDLLFGGTASSSAKFAFLNTNLGTPTASVSGSIAGVSTYLTGDGNLATTNMAPLTLGGTTTGNINFYSSANYINSSGNFVIAGNLTVPGTTTYNTQAYTWPGTQTASAFLQTDGAGTLSWVAGVTAASAPFSGLTGGTNTAAAMIVGSGATLGYTGTGTIDASSLIGKTWAIPGTIGSTTPNTGAFTTLSLTGNTTLGSVLGNTVTANAASWTFANDTNFALTGGLNGLSFDGTTLSIDAFNNRVGIGTATPGYTLDVAGPAAANYFVDNDQPAYGLDPAGTGNFGGYSMAITGGALLALDSGNVGIGNATPLAKLDVTGTASVSGILSLASSIGTQAMASLLIGNSTTGNIVINGGALTSNVVDSASAIGFTFNTENNLLTQGSKLLSVKNFGTEKFYIDKDGNLYTSGSIMSGNGMGILMTNKSGTTVAKNSLVVLDSANNSAFTTTTTPYSKAVFGVITGVGLGANDTHGAVGDCDALDVCMVMTAGEVDVTVKNASTAVKGDYLFTSDTAGSAVASAKQFDGLIGVVSNITNAASGYLKMIFKVQPQVTASAAIDKGSKHNEYWLYADNYAAVNQGTDTNANLLARGMMFDNFFDTTKTDSANTTVSGPAQVSQIPATRYQIPASPFRAGLIGGQTLSTSTTDNAGNTYLGSNTVNKTILYDRTRDPTPQVQVELGIDPNWYNGVTLSVATTSTQFSQNTTIVKNPSLSTTYDGSAVKVTGSYTTQAASKTIYVTIKSPTTFDWTDYNGNSATGVT